MPRRARIQVPGLPLHIVQRGHNRHGCFLESSGYQLYLALLDEYRRKCPSRIHAFVLMSNHVHLLMTPDEPRNASELMRHLNLRFVHFMNRKYGRTGSGWEGRFWSSIVETGGYFIRCQRYIELNPVRAGLVRDAAKYPWSSHACNAFGVPNAIVAPHAEYLALGGNDERRRVAYRALFREGLDDAELGAIRQAARSSLPYGSAAFLRDLESTLQRPMTRGRPGPRPNALGASNSVGVRSDCVPDFNG